MYLEEMWVGGFLVWHTECDDCSFMIHLVCWQVLGLSNGASQQEITTKWRALSREFHPDKTKDPTLKQAAQEKFMEIQQAYEILSNIKYKRSRKNKKYNPDWII